MLLSMPGISMSPHLSPLYKSCEILCLETLQPKSWGIGSAWGSLPPETVNQSKVMSVPLAQGLAQKVLVTLSGLLSYDD